MMTTISPLRDFIVDFTKIHDSGSDPERLQAEGAKLLRRLVSRDDWLPEPFAPPSPERYSQYLLPCAPLERFSV
ncbi:MAG: cysteine dioxygenase, partial [Acetobacter persici]